MSGPAPRACVIGWPIAHSRSPAIHGFWLARYGLAGSYGIEAVRPEELAAFIASMHEAGYAGCNVTVPHKEAVIAVLSRIDATARDIGAVNTIWREGQDWVGGNTDMHGFLANLDERAPGWERARSALVLGAGGAARAALAGLIARGIGHITLVNRSRGRADKLADAFAGRGAQIGVCESGQEAAALEAAGLLVNATSLGMAGSAPLTIDLSPMPADSVVCDLVYVPLETALLESARARGLRTVDGLGMLLHQAAPGFARWFGKKPQVDEALRAHVLASLEAEKAR